MNVDVGAAESVELYMRFRSQSEIGIHKATKAAVTDRVSKIRWVKAK